jgi:hypothetical protein
MNQKLRRSVRVGPLRAMLGTINEELKLPLHYHLVEVFLTFQNESPLGLPVFEETIGVLQRELRSLLEQPLRGESNESTAAMLFEHFRSYDYDAEPAFAKWKHPLADFALAGLEMRVEGVPDAIGHINGSATFRVEIS